MEVFTGDGDEDFPEHVTPFPATTDLIFDNPTAAIAPPEIRHPQGLPPPPQKLRPIRCNGRGASEYSDPAASNIPCAGDLLSCQGMAEVGFLAQELCALAGDVKDCVDVVGGGDMPERCGAAAGNGVQLPAAVAVPEVGNVNVEEGGLETESSSSSDSGSDSSEDITGLGNHKRKRKRKRRSRRRLELFLENLVAKVMQKQEQMHNQLIAIIEMKEKERILREEAWKQQEMERAKREEEVRAQQTSRSLALISFIQNLLGHEVQVPEPLQTVCLEENGGEIHTQEDLKYDQCDEGGPKSEVQVVNDKNASRRSNMEIHAHYDSSNRRWPKSEVHALIALRTALDYKFRSMGSKGSIWEEISVGLSNMGYSRTAKKCKEKWENINKYFKRTMGSAKKRPETAKTCPYFEELELLYKNGTVNAANAFNSPTDENLDKSAQN